MEDMFPKYRYFRRVMKAFFLTFFVNNIPY